MKSSLLKFVFLVSLALNLSVLATAGYLYHRQTGYWISPFGMKMAKDRFIFEELSLRPEQMAAMKARAMRFRAEIDSGRQEVSRKRKEVVALMRIEPPDVAAINAKIGEINALQGEMQRKIASHMLEEKALLGPEQQKKFLDLIEKAMGGGGQLACLSVAEHE
jgi:Spy/CpxP family protein refolding chaperone